MWILYAIGFAITLPVYLLLTLLIDAFEKSGHYVEVTAVTAGAAVLFECMLAIPRRRMRLAEQWAAGQEIDRATALEGTYSYARRLSSQMAWSTGVWAAVLSVVVGAIAGATGLRLVQYGILGAVYGTGVNLIAFHNIVEAALRPARVALAGDTGIGDSLPRSRPTFATRSNVSVVAVAFTFALGGAMLAAVFNQTSEIPVLAVVIGGALALGLAVPISVALGFSPSLQPIRDLAAGTQRVATGDYSQRVPVVQDNDLGALAASFNRMQAGLAERQRLQAAFGTYVDPALAARLLEQGDDVFTGERRQVTVMFVDIRDFTPFAEVNTAEDTVARLNALFEIVVPAVVDAGGHVNKFLGDGALAVFGAPNDLAEHADAAVNAAVLIHRMVAERFDCALRIGIGINTGVVIAGTIGGGGKLEFTLIGDTVNVAARVEQLTKTTGDAILLTEQSVEALASRPPGLSDRGSHALKGKSAAVQVFGLDPITAPSTSRPLTPSQQRFTGVLPATGGDL
jgi:class 3 adenylate cyclase